MLAAVVLVLVLSMDMAGPRFAAVGAVGQGRSYLVGMAGRRPESPGASPAWRGGRDEVTLGVLIVLGAEGVLRGAVDTERTGRVGKAKARRLTATRSLVKNAERSVSTVAYWRAAILVRPPMAS